jgi:hypothetical protein
MANPPKQKGTGGETELRLELLELLPELKRTPPGTLWDLEQVGSTRPQQILGTRPDRGQWLITMSLDDYRDVMHRAFDHGQTPAVRIEVKRYKRFSLHRIFQEKFGRSA